MGLEATEPFNFPSYVSPSDWGLSPSYADRLAEFARQGVYPIPRDCEIQVGSQDWQGNPDNVTAFATLVMAHVAVVQDAGHSLPTTYVSALLDRWL